MAPLPLPEGGVVQERLREVLPSLPQDVCCSTTPLLPKGACRPLLDTPCGGPGPGFEPDPEPATYGRCVTSQGLRAPTPRPTFVAVGLRPRELSALPGPYRPTLRGLDARWRHEHGCPPV